MIAEIVQTPVEDDGLIFDPTSVTTEQIAEDADYEGVRAKFLGHLGNARVARQTTFEAEPVGFASEFARDPSKAAQWKAFIRRSRLNAAPNEFTDVVVCVRDFLQPVVFAIADKRAFTAHWSPGGPWQPRDFDPK